MHINNYTEQEYNFYRTSFGTLPKKYMQVDKYLIRGPHPCFFDIFTLKKSGVNKIYDFRHLGIKGFKWLEKIACKLANIEYIRKPYNFLDNNFPTQKEYEDIAQDVLINGQNGGKTLFHCNSGTHRTSLMTAFYEITKGKPLSECKKENPKFKDSVDKILKKQVIDMNFFSRNRIVSNTHRPLKKIKNKFNNQVTESISKAYKLFTDMMQ